MLSCNKTKDIREVIEITKVAEDMTEYRSLADAMEYDVKALEKMVKKVEADMKRASKDLQFEQAAYLRDELFDLKRELSKVRSGK